jgi:hypothetical protein
MVQLSNIEIFSISVELITLLVVTLSFIKFHTGDCRGMLVSKTKSPDGQLVTREAKLSMHEFRHKDCTPSFQTRLLNDNADKIGANDVVEINTK